MGPIIFQFQISEARDVPDRDISIQYLVKNRHPVVSGVRQNLARYLLDNTVTFIRTVSGYIISP